MILHNIPQRDSVTCSSIQKAAIHNKHTRTSPLSTAKADFTTKQMNIQIKWKKIKKNA